MTPTEDHLLRGQVHRGHDGGCGFGVERWAKIVGSKGAALPGPRGRRPDRLAKDTVGAHLRPQFRRGLG